MYAKLAQGAKNFDILGLEINFQMNGQRTYNTLPGFFFTILLGSFLLYSFIQMVSDIQSGVNPITQRTSVYLDQNEVNDHRLSFHKQGFNFPPETFVFVTYIGDSNGLFIKNTPEKTYYTIKFIKRVQSLFGLQTNITEIGFGECSDRQLRRYSTFGAVLPKEMVICPPDDVIFGKSGIMNLENSIHLQNYTRFQFQVFRCVNSTKNNYTCATEEEIDAKLQNAVIQFSYPFYEFNSLNYSTPYEVKIGIKLMTINTQNTKVLNIIYKQSQTFTEQNIFYFFPSSRKDVGLEYYESYVDIQSDVVGSYLGGIQFSLDDMKFVYQRTYQNILNIFGAIGGTFSVLKTILVLLLKPLQKLQFAIVMFNKISDKKRQVRIQDYFKSENERKVIQEYNQIIQKAIELESYMEIMLKYENDLLTFRSDKLVSQNADLFKSQKLTNQNSNHDFFRVNQQNDEQQRIDQLAILQQHSEQVLSPRQEADIEEQSKKPSRSSYDYVVNDER